MSASALKTLRDALKKGTFDGAYYICGEDDFQKEDAMKQLIEAAVEPAMRDFNMDVRPAQETDAKSLDVALSALPMMADRRILVIRDASMLKKDARKVLDRYLAQPSLDVLLLLVETSGAKTDKELSRSSTLLDFPYLGADRIPRWITHHVSTQFQMRITSEAAELLQGAVGTDLHQLASELDKLASFAHGREIQESDVTAVVGVRRGETLADLLDVIAERNVSRALDLIPRILSQPKTTAVSVVMALSVQAIAMAWGKARLEEGLSQSRLQGEYFNFLKQAGSLMTGRSWTSAITAWTGSVNRWSTSSLGRALGALLEADIALKETKFSSDEQIMATLVLTMCVDDDRSMAA
ncbi:MAG: DNA polymerase III subunit delta [Gemmatimonadales bacterium]